MGKYAIRAKMRELKPTVLRLIDRKKLAKAIINGFGTREALRKMGFVVVSSHGCDCCDPAAYETWERGTKKVHTSFGYLDIPKKKG